MFLLIFKSFCFISYHWPELDCVFTTTSSVQLFRFDDRVHLKKDSGSLVLEKVNKQLDEGVYLCVPRDINTGSGKASSIAQLTIIGWYYYSDLVPLCDVVFKSGKSDWSGVLQFLRYVLYIFIFPLFRLTFRHRSVMVISAFNRQNSGCLTCILDLSWSLRLKNYSISGIVRFTIYN